MNPSILKRFTSLIVFLSLALALASGMSVLAQDEIQNLRIARASTGKVQLKWDHLDGAAFYDVFYTKPSGRQVAAGNTNGTSFTVKGLRPDTEYEFRVFAHDGRNASVRGSTLKERVVYRYVPPPVTCPYLPPHVVVTGYKANTQCQVVDAGGVGQMEVIKRGFIGAVDIWNFVPILVEVCIRGHGWMVLLDAEYSPRMAMELAHSHAGGFTCSVIDRAGTVVLVATGPPHGTPHAHLPAQPQEQTQEQTQEQAIQPALPSFEPIPLSDCFIKLVETLRLRTTPGGETIGLVWLNSEVPASEINGYWYKIEFEGKTGYISRYHRKVLRGGCG